MHLTAIYVFDNDADITGATLSCAGALFDRVICLDFGSVDGTRSLINDHCTKNSKFEFYAARKSYRGNTKLVLDSVAKSVARTPTQWIFSLAAMEFPKFQNREHLEKTLERYNNGWLDTRPVFPVPASYGDFAKFDFHQKFTWSGGLIGETLVVACSAGTLRKCGLGPSPLRLAHEVQTFMLRSFGHSMFHCLCAYRFDPLRAYPFIFRTVIGRSVRLIGTMRLTFLPRTSANLRMILF